LSTRFATDFFSSFTRTHSFSPAAHFRTDFQNGHEDVLQNDHEDLQLLLLVLAIFLEVSLLLLLASVAGWAGCRRDSREGISDERRRARDPWENLISGWT